MTPNHFTCIIIDDELDAIELLSGRLGLLYNNLEVIATYSNWKDALVALRNTDADIIMMDISMPGKTGINLLKLINGIESEIIFVTAHDNYALEAFELSASGYVLKPLDDAELKAAVDTTMQRVLFKKQANPAAYNIAPQAPSPHISEKIAVPNNHGLDYVSIKDILYLESVNKCTRIVTTDCEYTSTSNIGKFQYLIDNYSFFQIHRSFIINLNSVARYESSGIIIMSDKKEIPISRSVRNDFLQMFNGDI